MDFWDLFWLLLIFIPLLLVWVFALLDIFRRDDLSGWMTALWVLAVILAPFIGTLIYLILRPGGPAQRAGHTPDMQLLSDLHDRGKLSDEEFAEEKARILK